MAAQFSLTKDSDFPPLLRFVDGPREQLLARCRFLRRIENGGIGGRDSFDLLQDR